jgi:hypothetical protein
MNKTRRVAMWVVGLFGGFALTATPALADTLGEIAQGALQSFSDGNYGLAAVMLVVLATAAARKFLPKRYPFWRGDLGGSLLVLGAAFAATMAAALPTEGWSLGLLWTSAKVAAAASGGYTLVKRIGGALIGYASARGWIPGWANVALMFVLKMFQPRGEAAVKKAEAAGNAAVMAKPSAGLSGPSGELE